MQGGSGDVVYWYVQSTSVLYYETIHSLLSSYKAAANTSADTMAAFFVAMVLYPDVQKRAQLELDAVVGADRLPDFSDRPSLPYLNALVKELLRWHVVAPIGVPHRVVADDEYDGYLIPSGASVFVNIWFVPNLC